MAVVLQSVKEIAQASRRLLEELRKSNLSPNHEKRLDKTFPITEASKLVGVSMTAIREAEKEGRLPAPDVNPANNRRLGYSLEQLNRMRDVFGTRPLRNPTEDEPCVLSIQNFKGGVGKSTAAVHIAQYLARSGYRVLLIDCDSQASTTAMFGYSPDEQLTEADTIAPFIQGDQRTIHYCIRDTYYDGLKLIPANLQLYGIEYFLAARSRSDGDGPQFWHWLRNGIATVKGEFDVIVIDPPPALGMISMNALYAANAILIPMPPGMLDFYSTVQFFYMLDEVLTGIGEPLDYRFIKIMISRKKQMKDLSQLELDGGDDNEISLTAQDLITKMAYEHYGNYMMDSILYDSAEIESAAALGKTVYDLTGPASSSKTYKRALEALDNAGEEVLQQIRMSWPSHRRLMARKAV